MSSLSGWSMGPPPCRILILVGGMLVAYWCAGSLQGLVPDPEERLVHFFASSDLSPKVPDWDN
jgi:hypothetical protein